MLDDLRTALPDTVFYVQSVLPATQEMYGKVWPFIYALQGSNRAHREYFVRNRFALLDAKYGTSNFTSDNIDLYLARTAADTPDVLKITAKRGLCFRLRYEQQSEYREYRHHQEKMRLRAFPSPVPIR